MKKLPSILVAVLACVLAYAAPLPQDSDEHFGRGMNAFGKGQYDVAIDHFSKALEQDAFNVGIRFNRATCYLRLQKYDEAIKDLSKCIELAPDVTQAYMQRAAAYAATRQRPLALQDVDTVIARDSVFPRAHVLRARLTMDMGLDTMAACRDFRTALRLGDSTALKFMPTQCRQ